MLQRAIFSPTIPMKFEQYNPWNYLCCSVRFSPEALHWLFVKGFVGWIFQVVLLKITLFSLGSGEAPLLDIVAYAGYTFTGLSLAILGKLFWENAYFCYYLLLAWTCCCTAAFLLRTMKRVLYDSSSHHYLLILVAAQFPLMFWLGNFTLNWLLWTVD